MFRPSRVPVAILLAVAACATEAVTGPEPLTLRKVSGDQQSGTVGQPLAVPVQVRVVDASGRGVPGVLIAFEVTSGEGSLSGGAQSTDQDGVATAGTWTLGSRPVWNHLRARIVGEASDTVSFLARAEPGPFETMLVIAGDGQFGAVGEAVAIAPRVLLRDALDNPVPGVPIAFEVTGGGGSVVGANVTTGVDGTAQIDAWILGTTAGINTLTATARPAGAGRSGVDSVVAFLATAEPGPPAHIDVIDGDNQRVPAGTQVHIPPIVRVTDRFGNYVRGVPIEFSITAGGGSATGTSTVTSNAGLASVYSWTLGPAPGINTITATAEGDSIAGNPIVFRATATQSP